MTRIQQIEQRLAEIRAQLDGDITGIDIAALEAEIDKLNEERSALIEAETRRAALRSRIAGSGAAGSPVAPQARSYDVSSPEYRVAYMKHLRGMPLNTEERAALSSGTTSAGYAIPTVTLNRIIENLTQIAPLIGEVDLLQIPGNIVIPVEGTVNAAALHTENAEITAASDTITRIQLAGYEVAKLISISATLDTMTIDAFEGWIVSNLSRSLALIIENYLVNGTGSSQPKGIEKAETWSAGTNAVDWASTAPTVAEIETQIGLMNGAYIQNAKFLMTWNTFWTKIHTLRDDKHPEIVSYNGGKWYIFGFEVIFSAKVTAGTLFFGDYREGVKANFAKPITISRNESSGFRYNSIDFRGDCLFDCSTVPGRIIKSVASIS